MDFAESRRLLERATNSDAWAATRSSIREIDAANLLYPQYFSHAQGAFVWDVDGNRYIDFILGYGPIVLGHADERVNKAVFSELSKGSCISPMWSRRQVELTELLVTTIPGAESAYLMKTGSDATSAAVRLARIYTGQELVIKWGYNGWHDWTAPRTEGVPQDTLKNTIIVDYNDLALLEEVFEQHSGRVACVIMMPFELERPKPNYLQAVKRIAHQNNALFIIDDMRSGFRVALGGAQEYFDVTADLATFSKAMANGFPISAVVGQSDILKGLGKTHMSSTFFANPAEMAAAITTISILRDCDASSHLWALGTRFVDGLSSLIQRFDVPAKVCGYPISPLLEFTHPHEETATLLKTAFFKETIREGVLFHPNHQWYFSLAHTTNEIDYALNACEKAFSRICKLRYS